MAAHPEVFGHSGRLVDHERVVALESSMHGVKCPSTGAL
jgi:hypothetical protein